MHLKEDGETVVIDTMLWEGTPRKQVFKIRDLKPHPEPDSIYQVILGMGDDFFADRVPVHINEATYLFYTKGFVNCDRDVYKAILNGYPIDTQSKTELTDDLLQDQ